MAKANMTVNVTWEMEVERLPKDTANLKQTAIIIAYNSVCNEIVQLFCDKQDMEFDGWVGGTVGGFADCGGLSFSFSDIVFDIKTGQPKGKIVEWFDNEERINYPTYTKVMSIKTTT